jgi:acetyl esterase/lipase
MGLLQPHMQWASPPGPDFVPGPLNGNLSIAHPQYETLFRPVQDATTAVWEGSMTVEEVQAELYLAPPAIPDGCPEPGVDIDVSYATATTRDGAELSLKIYRGLDKKKTKKDKRAGDGDGDGEAPPPPPLVLRIHGGGWVVGSHQVEEAENRYLAADAGVVVVSVEYRM